MEKRWHSVKEEGFEVAIPIGWEAEPDPEEGGLDIWNPEGPGDLHLVGFENGGSDAPDPAAELYAFLEDQEIELEEDEVEDLELFEGGEMAICEYLAEAEEEGEPAYWLIGVAALPGRLVFAHYSCASSDQDTERDAVVSILRTLRPTDSGSGAGR